MPNRLSSSAALASLFLTACAALPASAQGASDTAVPAYLQKDLAELTEMMTGRWDNDRHNFFAEDAGMDQSVLAPRQHLVIQPIEGSNGAKLRATRKVEGSPDAELVHAFSADGLRAAIRQTIMRPGGVLGDEAVGCAILWTRSASGFSGKGEGAACPQIFPRPATGGALGITAELSEDDFWITSKRGDLKIEARMRRARPFECWTAILRGVEHGDSGEGVSDDQWDFRTGILLHDQYGEAVLTTDETPPRTVRLRLRNVDWPYGKNRPSLSFYVHEGVNERATSYAWGEGDAERIGLNLRWLQASCTHAPDKVFEDF